MNNASDMDLETKLSEQLYQYLVFLFDKEDTYQIKELLLHSDIYIKATYRGGYENAENLHLIVNPEIYKKYNSELKYYKNSIIYKLNEFSHKEVVDAFFYPNLNKFQILHNTFIPVLTSWETINTDQNILLSQLRTAKEKIEFQNIGNTARTIMQKISNLIFDPSKHIAPTDIDLSIDKFKNRLHAYLNYQLKGESKELKDYYLSVITSNAKAIDLFNKLTHDLDADSLLAESCVISTLTVISIIKLLYNKN